jgi:maltose O-acetyltransferase
MWAKLRIFFCRPLLRHCGRNVHINRLAHFGKGHELSIGDNSSLGINARIVGDVTIGNNVGMAHNVFITASARYFDDTEVPLIYQGKKPDAPVVIEDNCVIFAEVIILPGVTIHSGTVVGAAAVVSRDVPPNSIVAGNPAPDADFTGMTPIACALPKPAE